MGFFANLKLKRSLRVLILTVAASASIVAVKPLADAAARTTISEKANAPEVMSKVEKTLTIEATRRIIDETTQSKSFIDTLKLLAAKLKYGDVQSKLAGDVPRTTGARTIIHQMFEQRRVEMVPHKEAGVFDLKRFPIHVMVDGEVIATVHVNVITRTVVEKEIVKDTVFERNLMQMLEHSLK